MDELTDELMVGRATGRLTDCWRRFTRSSGFPPSLAPVVRR